MNKFSTALLLLATFLTGEVGLVQAQTSTSSSMYQDGSGESRSTRRERIKNYRRQSSELQQKIGNLGSTITEVVSVPILFGVSVNNISPNFGDPRSGGRTHEGEDIMSPKGTPIVSPTKAVVLRTGVGATEGNYVYTANPGGETFVYMHLDRIGEGVTSGKELEQGDLIGYVGNTGNASGGGDHLHFEIHNSSNDPIDPFPRLKGEFSIQDKVTYLSKILTQTPDPKTLAELLVRNFRSTFTAAFNANIALPVLITDAMLTIPAANTPSIPGTLPIGDLDIGSSGSVVVTLQRYLIAKATGPAASRLSIAGATGNFGPLTQAALIEFQVANGITPANGYYGVATRTYIASNPATGVITTPPVVSNSGTSATFTRDLNLGKTGEDVRTLQKKLNALGFTVSLSGAGSAGNETTYFGPATQAAVIKYQIAKGITPAAGYFGPITRASIAQN